jgi:hypothetical protein
MLHSPIGNAKSPASVGRQTQSFNANQTIEIKPALPEDGKSDGFTLGRAPTAKDSAPAVLRPVNRHGHVEAGPCRRRASARRFIQDGVTTPFLSWHATRVPRQGQGLPATPICVACRLR